MTIGPTSPQPGLLIRRAHVGGLGAKALVGRGWCFGYSWADSGGNRACGRHGRRGRGRRGRPREEHRESGTTASGDGRYGRVLIGLDTPRKARLSGEDPVGSASAAAMSLFGRGYDAAFDPHGGAHGLGRVVATAPGRVVVSQAGQRRCPAEIGVRWVGDHSDRRRTPEATTVMGTPRPTATATHGCIASRAEAVNVSSPSRLLVAGWQSTRTVTGGRTIRPDARAPERAPWCREVL